MNKNTIGILNLSRKDFTFSLSIEVMCFQIKEKKSLCFHPSDS